MFPQKTNIFNVKLAILVCAVLALICLYIYSGALNNAVDNCNIVNGDLSLYYKICGRITCQSTGDMSVIGCRRYQCEEGKNQIGYKQDDNSKPYPECCGGPICHSANSPTPSWKYGRSHYNLVISY